MIKNLKVQIPKGYEIDVDNSTFHDIVFKKIENKLSKTWEEFCEQNPVNNLEYYINGYSEITKVIDYPRDRGSLVDRNLLSTMEDTEKHRALMQLHRLRDVYRQGWVPNWGDCSTKWCIYYVENGLALYPFVSNNRFLSFQSQEIAREFLKNFRELIIKAGDLV